MTTPSKAFLQGTVEGAEKEVRANLEITLKSVQGVAFPHQCVLLGWESGAVKTDYR